MQLAVNPVGNFRPDESLADGRRGNLYPVRCLLSNGAGKFEILIFQTSLFYLEFWSRARSSRSPARRLFWRGQVGICFVLSISCPPECLSVWLRIYISLLLIPLGLVTYFMIVKEIDGIL